MPGARSVVALAIDYDSAAPHTLDVDLRGEDRGWISRYAWGTDYHVVVTRQLKALQELGWIERSTSERDNRMTNVTLTTQGRDIVDQAMPRRSAFLQDVLAGVSETTMHNLSKGLAQLEAGIADAVARTERDAA